MTALDGDELRALVRATLREVLPQLSTGDRTVEPVQLRDDADLQAFVARVVALAQDPATAQDLRDGRHRFTLAPGSGSVSGQPAAAVAPQRVTRGAVLERHVRAAASAGTRIIAAPGVVVTPLARERARTSGVEIVTERSGA